MLVMFRAQEALDEFEKSPLQYSKVAAKEMSEEIRRLFQAHRKKDAAGKETDEIDWSQTIKPYLLDSLKRAIADFETLLARESPGMPVFFVPQKGIYNTTDLIEHAEQDFANHSELSMGAIKEIQQAGRCLAFDLFTAHAFHMMRAAEIVVLALLQEYYNESVPTAQRNWGQYVSILRRRGAPPDLLRFLDEVVRIERNESIHPTKLLTEVEAQIIHTIAKGAIMAMVEHIETLEAYDPLAESVGGTIKTPS